MPSKAIATVVKMMESLPEPAREQVVAHLRNYLEDPAAIDRRRKTRQTGDSRRAGEAYGPSLCHSGRGKI